MKPLSTFILPDDLPIISEFIWRTDVAGYVCDISGPDAWRIACLRRRSHVVPVIGFGEVSVFDVFTPCAGGCSDRLHVGSVRFHHGLGDAALFAAEPTPDLLFLLDGLVTRDQLRERMIANQAELQSCGCPDCLTELSLPVFAGYRADDRPRRHSHRALN